MWLAWCPKIQKLLARSLFEIHAKVSFSLDGWLVASIWAWYLILRNSIVALVRQRAYFGVWRLFKILWKSLSCSLIQHCSSLGDLHVVLLIACFHGSILMSWGFWCGHCWFVWQNLIENQQKIWQSCFFIFASFRLVPWIWTGMATRKWTLWAEGFEGMREESSTNYLSLKYWMKKPVYEIWNTFCLKPLHF